MYINKLIFATVAFLSINTAFAADKLNQFEDQMVNKVWITTDAIDAKNQAIAPSDNSVTNFFGIAQYNTDHTFKMYTPEGKLKLAGDWSISDDGKNRVIVAKKSDGTVLFTRTVENVAVKADEYTYRIYPDANNSNVYFDIVHKPLSDLLSAN